MIKTKSRSCEGVNSIKRPQDIRAGYDYNPALQSYNVLIILGAQGCSVKSMSPRFKHYKLKRLDKNMSKSFEWHIFLESVEDLCREVEP